MQGWGGSSGWWGLLGLTPFLEGALYPSLFSREMRTSEEPWVSWEKGPLARKGTL